MQKRTDYPPRWCASLPESLKSHLGRLARQQNGHTLNSEINAIHQHVDASHKQTSADLEKVRQFISEVLQNEVQRNMALRVLIQRLEERASEGTRSLSDQVESNRQLKLQVHELQKHLEDKDHSLAQANQTVAFLKHQLKDLYQQLQSHQNNHRTIQEVTEWLQDDEANPNVVESETGCSSGQSEAPVPGGSSLIGRLSGGSPVIGEMQLLPTALSGIKEEEADAGYEHSQTDGDGAQTERQQAVPLPVNIKLENMEDEGGCEEGSTKAQTQSCRVGSPGEPPGH
ncbi:uncharacterized protein LOC134442823, partial [Engraulis encrasicolus]|uniref:uncharacterized protein LOC134442823 n=1 Tax=Engraulis encrasicolus TaxID=184585 RepID=UPI002FD635B7